jgi:hypothetical protein
MRKPWELHWPEGEPSAEIVAATVADIAVSLEGLSKAEDLIFHTVFVGENSDGPLVMVWSEMDDDRLHCEYHAEPKWATINEVYGEEQP